MTIVAAWISALTGVGPSIASGSQVWSGIWADFATAPPSRPSATSVTTVFDSPSTLPKTPSKSTRSGLLDQSRKIASAIVASPTAFMTNAFFAAAIAEGRSWWKPISRYDARPTRPQPASSSTRFPHWTRSSIEKTKIAMYAK